MYPQSIAELEKALTLSQSNVEILASMAHVHAASGYRAKALQLANQLNALSKQRHVDPYFVALVHLGLGENDQAFHSLERAVQERSIMFLWFKIEPRLDRIRSDPRYTDLVQRLKAKGERRK